MNDPVGVARSFRHERRFRRFTLRYPVHLLFQSGDAVCEMDTVSRNVSVGGLLLECPADIPEKSPVSFLITVSGRTLRPVKLAGEGSIVRVQRENRELGWILAVECKTPILQIEYYLPLDAN